MAPEISQSLKLAKHIYYVLSLKIWKSIYIHFIKILFERGVNVKVKKFLFNILEMTTEAELCQ